MCSDQVCTLAHSRTTPSPSSCSCLFWYTKIVRLTRNANTFYFQYNHLKFNLIQRSYTIVTMKYSHIKKIKLATSKIIDVQQTKEQSTVSNSFGVWILYFLRPIPIVKLNFGQVRVEFSCKIRTHVVMNPHANKHQAEWTVLLFIVYL